MQFRAFSRTGMPTVLQQEEKGFIMKSRIVSFSTLLIIKKAALSGSYVVSIIKNKLPYHWPDYVGLSSNVRCPV